MINIKFIENFVFYGTQDYNGSECLDIVSEIHIQLLKYIYDDFFDGSKLEHAKELNEVSFFMFSKYLFE